MRKGWSGQFASLICLCFLSIQVAADTPVWKVSKSGKYLYVAGTIHILNETDYPLPIQFNKAYDDSDSIFIEVDIDRLAEPRVRKRIFEQSTYPEGKSLKDEISRDTLMELSRYCSLRNLSLRELIRYRPGAVASILTSVEYSRLALNGTGVDMHYLMRARKDKKPVGYLDSVQTQFQLSMDLNQGNPDEVIRYSLSTVFSAAEHLGRIKTAWREGDLKAMEELSVAPMQQYSPDTYQSILAERNLDWIPKIEKMLRDDRVEFVLFGAAHLVGEHGVLPLLEQKGYRIERFY
ncbi:MAG: TraB/GumN family protein [Pseudomonadota bacterium]